MRKRGISFDESCARPCVFRLVECGGPTASGLDGYICENCAEFVLAQAEGIAGAASPSCGYCGQSPGYSVPGKAAVCGRCASAALQAARCWYRHLDSDRMVPP